MHAWETTVFYLSHHPRWFESPLRRVPDDRHLTVHRELVPDDWTVWRRGYWLICEPPGHDPTPQGWKLHVSATSHTSADVLRRVLPVLRDAGARFKYLMDPAAVRESNSKTFSRGSSGKFVTVYPVDDAQFRALAADLADALADVDGPYVLTDRRCPGSRSVYYRYGGFISLFRRLPRGNNTLLMRTPDGDLVPDVRLPYWSPPEWATDPFPDPDEPVGDGTSLADGRFTVTEAISFSNRGGVYRAIDAVTGADVILREARPMVEVGREGRDAIDVLRNEYEILRALEPTGLFVTPLAFFHEWEHAFLAEEFVDGTHLGRFTIVQNPLYDLDLTADRLGSYYERMRHVWCQIADAVAAAHERGVVLGDLSPTNVMVADDDTVRCIDLESAEFDGAAQGAGLTTPGMANRRTRDSGTADRRNDYYALGALMLCSVLACHQTAAVDHGIAGRLLDRLAADLGLPEDLVTLINDLRADDDDAVPDPHLLRKRLDGLPLDGTWTRPVPLAAPAAPAENGTRVRAVIDGVCRYIDATADLGRGDRLFPADLTVFETNPLSVAFGAYGVFHTLRQIRGDVDPFHRAWALQRSTSHTAMPPGLYYGQAGVAWVLSTIDRPELGAAVLRSARGHPLRLAGTGVLAGCAGYGLACLRLWRDTGLDEFLDDAREIGEHLAATAVREERGGRGERDGSGVHWVDDQGRTPVGYGSGGSGVAMFLLGLHAATGDTGTLRLGRDALDFDLSRAHRHPHGLVTFPAFAPDGDGSVAVQRHYWDEGTAGVLTTLLRYHHVTGDPVLRRWIDDLLPDVCRSYTAFPQLFHGAAGIGNAVLDAYEFLGDEHLLHQAWRTAEGILPFAVERREGITFPGEQTLRESADYATGSAGIALFLHRLLHARPGQRSNTNFVVDDLLETA